MNLFWHKTVHIHSRILEVQPPHEFGEWTVFHPYGSGKGIVVVQQGPSNSPPAPVKAMLRVEDVWRVIVSKDGYFIITVTNERDWNRIESEVIEAYVKA